MRQRASRSFGRLLGRPLGRRLTIAGLVLLPVLLAVALWFVPRLTDWNEHRDRLAILAAGRLGQPVTLTGPVKLALLPQPMLEAGGVTIGGPDSSISVEARALRLRLDWLALLRLRLEPREVTLVGAEIRLPWPPVPGQSFRPPPWLTGLQGRIQDSRVMIGQLGLERVTATLAAGAATDAVQITGRFRWRQTEVAFEIALGRPGGDGAAPLTLTLSGGKASLSASGVLLPEGGFEGSLQGGGSDLAALLPAPSGSFRLRGRLSVTAELLTAEDLVLDVAGTPARGAATLRVAPAPRLDLALATSRVELDPWIAALRRAGPLPLPFGLDLSAEAAGFRGLTLRRLRGAALLAGDRLTLTDVGAVLPGDTEIELSGATTSRPPAAGQGAAAGSGERLEARVRFQGTMLRGTLLALGLPLEGTRPDRLREGEGRFRLVLDETQAAIPEFTATLDGGRVSGAGVLRFGSRPALGVGLTFERLPLDGWLRPGLEWPAAQAWLAGMDANLRLSAERAQWHDLSIQGLSADASLENGRLTARRLSGRLAGGDVALSGVAQLGPALQLSDLALEVNAPGAAQLLALVPGDWPDQVPIGEAALALRLSGSGPLGALALRGSLELGDLRAEASGMLDLPGRRYAGGLTLRHPGAPRLLGELAGLAAPPWLGEGSFSLVGNLTASPEAVHAESFDLVAAGLRLGGLLDLNLEGARPRLSGRLAAERLPLPGFDWNARDPFPLAPLSRFDAELPVRAQRVEPLGLPPLEAATAALRLRDGVLELNDLKGLFAGGQLDAGLRVEAGATPPVFEAQGRLAGVALAEPLPGLPVDLKSGQVEAEASLRAAGHSPAALMATLGGQAQVAVRNGVLEGTDLRAALAVSEQASLSEAESSLRQALLGGATAFGALQARLRFQSGHVVLEEGRLALPEAPDARLGGEFDLARGGMDLRLVLRDGEAPEFGLRMTGSAARPRLVPEMADWLRWRAER
ncbi:AsmA family protein [Roseomonas sp. M0104]|uniref:AsmA family protein n=1 Tax=Teichococcus coralli TaxID=2545983 RepID=A0A845BBG2_9PROT|nr:AsmA family protein [Pseudoroseomonas coralli]MXP62707.1 AsmA family protein [Pseudoroseomonas coralli]